MNRACCGTLKRPSQRFPRLSLSRRHPHFFETSMCSNCQYNQAQLLASLFSGRLWRQAQQQRRYETKIRLLTFQSFVRLILKQEKKNLQYFLLTSLIFNNICRFVLQFCEVSPSSPKEHSYFKCNASILRHKKFLSPHSISINGALRICFSSQVCPALLN